MWVERAEKILRKAEWIPKVVQFMEHVSLISKRFSEDYSEQLRKHAQVNLEAAKVRKEFFGMLELFETHQPDYDIWDFKNEHAFSIFIENFEQKAESLERASD